MTEVKVLSQLDHPNIVAFFDAFESDGILSIEMEYADGGNLADFLAKQKMRLPESEIIYLFRQMASGIRYMHAHASTEIYQKILCKYLCFKGVLHRDLKTANIFLTAEGMAKIGDFGIAKLSETMATAHTVVGTPYYISPEMCEGKGYDSKSDIWALGCILYEMACLQKAFDGSNLPALVNKIVQARFAPIRGNYSGQFKQLVRDMLQRDPEFRPSSAEILLSRLPELSAQLDNMVVDELEEELLLDSNSMAMQTVRMRQGRPHRSVLYVMSGFQANMSLTPIQLPARAKISAVSVSNTHMIALTSDNLVFTWGDGRRGQLGHGQKEPFRAKPSSVEALKSKAITHVGAGDGFSVFTSDNGIVMTCGDGSFGALGHGDWQSSSLPMMVEALLSVDISAVNCGNEHVVVVAGHGHVYTWGRGRGGRLGTGSEDDSNAPIQIDLDNNTTKDTNKSSNNNTNYDARSNYMKTSNVIIVNAACNGDATLLLSDTGLLYACGGNRYNRLGLDENRGFIVSSHTEKVLRPTLVKALQRYIVVDLAMGPHHSVCITDTGQVVTFGRNSEAQLGRNQTGTVGKPQLVRFLQNKMATMVACGNTFTIMGSSENVVYFWGTRHLSNPLEQSFNQLITMPNEANNIGEAEISAIIEKEVKRSGQDVQIEENDHPLFDELTLKEVIAEPKEILALYASPQQLEQGENVVLNSIICNNQNVFVVVNTTCPLPTSNYEQMDNDENGDNDDKKREIKKKKKKLINNNKEIKRRRSEPVVVVDMGDEDEEMPEWLAKELKEAEAISPRNKNRNNNNNNNKKNNNKNDSDDDEEEMQVGRRRSAGAALAAYRRRLEREFGRRQMEIRMEAQNAVRERERALNERVGRLEEELQRERERNEQGGAQQEQQNKGEGCCLQ